MHTLSPCLWHQSIVITLSTSPFHSHSKLCSVDCYSPREEFPSPAYTTVTWNVQKLAYASLTIFSFMVHQFSCLDTSGACTALSVRTQSRAFVQGNAALLTTTTTTTITTASQRRRGVWSYLHNAATTTSMTTTRVSSPTFFLGS